jgi:predicted P-loop ATPase
MPKRPTPTLVSAPVWRPLLRPPVGKPIADFRNVMIVLRNEPGFAVAFAFDEMQQAVIVRAPPPICGDAQPGAACPRFADEEDISRLQEWMQMIMPKVGRETIHWALEDFARENPIHPLRLMLRTRDLTVRQPILDNWLTPALGVPNDAYHNEIGRRFAIAMVARIMQPGCQCDYMLVLEGPQGEMKSQFCRMLAGPEYFSDHVPDLRGDQVRMSMHFRGKWLVEFSDLAAFRGAEVELLKATITRRVEIYTPKYGRKERHEPRQCLFIGTTNVDDWIKDETGGRRFWPVKVVKIDLEWLAEYRDQLFAEAVEAYDAGKPWWPDRNFERRVIAPHQEKRQAFDNWTDRVLEMALSLPTVTIALIYQGMGSVSHGADLTKLDMLAQKRIAAILKKGGYEKTRITGGRIVWKKAENSEPF